MGKLLIASIAICTVLALPAASIAGPAFSVKSQGQWYWSADVANAAFANTKLDNGTIIDSADCHGSGASIASQQVDVDLFHQFRCKVFASTFSHKAQFDAAVNNATSRAVKLDAEAKRAQYEAHGDPVSISITLIVTGRRDSRFA